MQAKLKRANLNGKDSARNKRGVFLRAPKEEEISRKFERGLEVKSDEEDDILKVEKKTFTPIEELGEFKNYKFKILFENDRVMVIDKPINMMVHPDGRSKEITISDIVYYSYPEMRNVGEADRPGVVHRLDKNTSGCLILCKTQDSHKDVKNLFKEHKVRKVYRAVVEGNIRDDIGVIDRPLARARSDFRKKATIDMYSKDFRGEVRDAITKYKVLARSTDKKFTYVELYPVTGRTHQLRVHMRSIRHPIIGDELYGSNTGATLAPRSMLHSYKIEFVLRKEEVNALSPIPQDMQEIVDKYFGN